MVIMAGLIADLGNSETRAMVLVNNKVIEFTLSNKFAELQSKYKYPSQYRNEKSNVFKHGNMHFANGQIVEREFVGLELRPVAIEAKTEQQVTELSMTLVLMRAIIELGKLYDVPCSELDVTFDISVLLPPLEHEVNEDKLKNIIKSIQGVEALVPQQMSVGFKINEVNVYPEGLSAFFGVLFREENNELVEVAENLPYTSGYTLVLDIGAGTTDVVLIKDSELVQNSKDTFKLGGNTVDSYVANECKKRYDYAPQNVTEVVMTGDLVEGTKVHHVEEIVTDAKINYSKSMMSNLRGYLERLMLPVKELKGILIVGGGSVASYRGRTIVSPPMSEVLMEYFTKLAPNAQMLSLGNVKPRKANITGLKFMHKYN